jgi:hypothetical protein
MRLVTGANLLDSLPRDFPKWAEPEVFGLQSIGKSRRGVDFARRLPRTKTKNGNCPADVVILFILLVLSQLPFRYPEGNKPSPGAALVLQIIGK